MKDVLALDLATLTGFATNVYSKELGISGTVPFEKDEEFPGMRFVRCRKWLEKTYELLGSHLDLIVYEQAHHRGGAATQCCVGLVSCVLMFCADKKIKSVPVHSQTLKKWATGHGKASKDQMIMAAEARGWQPADDNEADAILLLEYALDKSL